MQTPEIISDSSEIPTAAPVRSRALRRVLQAAAVLIVLLALLLTPPLLNVNRLQRRIASNMSQSLGRPVHLDDVTLHLLPMPGFTLKNLVVSEDPAFGNEPVIRANRVEATVRVSSLWRRHVEISRISFVTDDFGTGASLNIVRNAQGRWNLEGILNQAALADTAPTGQPQAGPAPRFPYIEATGARVNLKLADEKMPFSLTDADFALSLISPQQWRVRLLARPARTDTSINDPGELRLDATLNRASNLSQVPIDLHASWHKAPLGEATKVLLGADADWRGTLNADLDLTGTLAAATLTTKFTLNDLRRADFIPAQTLTLHADCTATADIPHAILLNPACRIPIDSPTPTNPAGPAVLNLVADTLTLTGPALTKLHPTALRIGTPGLPQDWLLDWARLFSQSIPTTQHPTADLSGSLTYDAAWQGTLTTTVPTLTPISATDSTPTTLTFTAQGTGRLPTLTLAPTNLQYPGKTAPLTLSGTLTPHGYALTLTGTATLDQLRQLRSTLPPLGEALLGNEPTSPDSTTSPSQSHSDAKETASPIPEGPATPTPRKLDLLCTRQFPTPETCTTQLPRASTLASHRPAKK